MSILDFRASKGVDTYKRLLQASKPYWLCFLIGAVGTIIVSMTDALFAWLIKPIIDKGFIDRDITFIRWIPAIILFLFAVRSIASYFSSYCVTRVARSVVRDFRKRLFEHLLRLPAKFYDRNNSGHLLSVVIYNVEQVAQASSDALITVLTESSLVVGLVVVMLMVNWQLFLLCMVMVPAIAIVIKWSGSRMRRLSRTVQQSVGDVTHVAGESINGYKVVRLFGGQAYESDKFNRAVNHNWVREIKVAVTMSLSTAIVQFLIAILIAVAMIVATLPGLKITAGDFGTIISSMLMILRPLRRLTLVNNSIQKGVAGADGIFRVLDEAAEIDTGHLSLTHAVQGNIEYQNVSFAYDAANGEVLQDISFTIKPGQTVAIVGRSGSGKSTLVNLLPRFYEFVKGRICIDGIDIKDLRLTDLRRQFALVSQQTVLFNDTIARNIAYGLGEDVTPAQIVDAAEAAYAMEFINELPAGLQTMIGEDGALLSGGQRQRIAIARALLKKAPILILDEATSALDTDAERQIQTALTKLMKQCTTVVIAHRLSTIENADWILVMDSGRLLEQGTHADLLANNAIYARLHRMQFQDYSELSLSPQPTEPVC